MSKCFIFHDWSKWSDVTTPYGAALHQHRVCLECGMIKTRSLGFIDGANAKTINDAIEGVLGDSDE